MAIKKSSLKKAAPKTSAPKASPKVALDKKAPAKKATKKSAAPKKPLVSESAVVATSDAAAEKKAPVKKVVAKKVVTTTIIANVDVGFGNSLYIRGEGAGLSWDAGTLLENVSPYEWSFTTTKASDEVTFKFLINDENWSEGDDLVVAAGGTSVSAPVFDR